MIKCQTCREDPRPATQVWLRQKPGFCELRVCQECAREFVQAANDRGPEFEEAPRMHGMYSRLGGEVWVSASTVYWFRASMVPRITALIGELEDFRMPLAPMR